MQRDDQQTNDRNFGWQLNSSSPPPPQIRGMPMPQPILSASSQPYPVPSYDNRPSSIGANEVVVEETFRSKDAGAMSFAHYITKWVSFSEIIHFP